jgi:guanylate kinase
MNETKGKFVLIVGPTCVGKTTLIEALRGKLPDTGVIVSTTTRSIRPNEENGVDYEFTTNEDFVRRREAGEFYEAVERPTGYYGSSRLQVHELLKKHAVVFGALDVEGCRIVKNIEPEVIIVFLYPGDMSDLRERLLKRGTGEEEMRARLHIASEEMLSKDEFDESVENFDGKFEETVKNVLGILEERGVSVN